MIQVIVDQIDRVLAQLAQGQGVHTREAEQVEGRLQAVRLALRELHERRFVARPRASRQDDDRARRHDQGHALHRPRRGLHLHAHRVGTERRVDRLRRRRRPRRSRHERDVRDRAALVFERVVTSQRARRAPHLVQLELRGRARVVLDAGRVLAEPIDEVARIVGGRRPGERDRGERGESDAKRDHGGDSIRVGDVVAWADPRDRDRPRGAGHGSCRLPGPESITYPRPTLEEGWGMTMSEGA